MLIGTVLLAVCLPQGNPSSDIDQIVRRTKEGLPSVGVQVAVAQEGRIIFEQGYGLADLEQKVPVTRNTVFHADSITKHLTAALMLRLVSEGKTSLSDSVRKYVPEFNRDVTIDELLSHTSGMQSYSDSDDFGATRDRLDWTHGQVLDVIKKEPSRFKPGTSWMYSNSAFYLAGLAIESITKRPYGDAMKEEIFDKLEMKHSAEGLDEPIIDGRARGYDWVKRKALNTSPINWQAVFSAGNACTTAGDLLRFEIGLEKGLLFSKDQVSRMRSPHSVNGVNVDYGLGTRLGSFYGHKVVGHTGSGGGFNNIFVDFPDDGVMIAVLSNLDSEGLPRAICGRLSHQLLGIPLEEAKQVAVEEATKAMKFGTYRTENGLFEVQCQDGKLSYRPGGSTGPGVPLPYLGKLRVGTGPDGYVQMIAQHGEVTWLMFYQNGLLMDACPRVEPANG